MSKFTISIGTKWENQFFQLSTDCPRKKKNTTKLSVSSSKKMALYRCTHRVRNALSAFVPTDEPIGRFQHHSWLLTSQFSLPAVSPQWYPPPPLLSLYSRFGSGGHTTAYARASAHKVRGTPRIESERARERRKGERTATPPPPPLL